MKRRSSRIFIYANLLLLSLITACQSAPVEPTPAPIAAVADTATPVPTATHTSTPTQAPTALPPTLTHTPSPTPTESASPTPDSTNTPVPPPTFTPSPTAAGPTPTRGEFMRGQVIGSSSGGYPLEAFSLGWGPQEIIVVGGLHGGYEWNTIMLSYEIIDYFTLFPERIPDHITLTVIPAANPDGQVTVVGQPGRFARSQVSAETRPGRFNSNGVDLNRNWGCEWAPNTYWGTTYTAGGGGTGPFSERESWDLRNYLVDRSPRLVIFLHSAAPGIFPGRCGDVQVPDTLRFSQAYSAGSGYRLAGSFDYYEITGESSDTLNFLGIASFTVELNNYVDTDFDQNIGGLLQVFDTPLGSDQ